MKHFLWGLMAILLFAASGGCRQPPSAPSVPTADLTPDADEIAGHDAHATEPDTEETTIEAAIALTEEFGVALSIHGDDCDKTAGAINEFAAKHGERLKILTKAVSAFPAETEQRVQAKYGSRIGATTERMMQVNRRCKSNPNFAAAFGAIVEKRTELPPSQP